jgi:CRP/FNR family cyclic AMP-dependent transcriptional regulator
VDDDHPPLFIPIRERVRLLSMVDVFEGLSLGELEGLAGSCEAAEFGPGEEIFSPKTGCERVFVLEVTLGVFRGGTVFGRMEPTAPSQGLHAQAVASSLVSSLAQHELERLVGRRPEVGLRLARSMSERLFLTKVRGAELVQKEVLARLAALLLRLVGEEGVVTREGLKIPTRYTHAELGAMIGANREAATRAFGKLRESGAVGLRDRLVVVTDAEALVRASE